MLNWNHRLCIFIRFTNRITFYSYNNIRCKLFAIYASSDCVFITLTKTVLRKFIVEMELNELTDTFSSYSIKV